jgi:WD40 repeat protein
MSQKVTLTHSAMRFIVSLIIVYLSFAPSITPITGQSTPPFNETLVIGTGRITKILSRPLSDQIAVINGLGVTIYDGQLNQVRVLKFPNIQRVDNIAWSPDGQKLAASFSITYDQYKIQIFDSTSYNLSVDITENSILRDLSWNPTGQMIAAGWENGAIIWDTLSGQQIKKLMFLESAVGYSDEVVWNANGSQIITLSDQAFILIWDIMSGNLIIQYNRQDIGVRATTIALNPAKTKIAIGGLDGSVQIRNLNNFALETQFNTSLESISSLIWNNDILLTSRYGAEIKLYNTLDWSIINTLSSNTNLGKLDLNSPLLSRVIGIVSDDVIEIRNIANGQTLHQLTNFIGTALDLAWCGNSTLVANSRYHPIQFIDVLTGVIINKYERVMSIEYAISADLTCSNIISVQPNVELWKVTNGQIMLSKALPDISNTSVFAWKPDGSQFAVLRRDGVLTIWDKDGILLTQPTIRWEGGKDIGWRPDGSQLSFRDHKDNLIILNTVLWSVDKIISGANGGFSWKQDSTQIAVANHNGEPDLLPVIEIYNTNDWKVASRILDQGEMIRWQPNGNFIVGINYKNEVVVWNIDLPSEPPEIMNAYISGNIQVIQWSPDGSKFAVGGADATIRIFTRTNPAGTPTPTLTPTLTPTPRPDTPAIYRPATSTFHFPTLPSVTFGNPNDHPITGDWDGDGIDTLGVFDPLQGRFQLRNSNTPGAPDLSFLYGNPGDIPLAGHWTATATHDGVGTYRNTNGTMCLFLRNQLSTGYADLTAIVGNPGDLPIVGDWNGDGVDTVGLYRPDSTTFYLFNRNAPDMEVETQFTLSGGVPIAGRWTGSGGAGVGFFADGVFSLKDTPESGAFDRTVSFGMNGDIPLTGRWSP